MIYINIEDDHFKFWGYEAISDSQSNRYEVRTFWGKIGCPLDYANVNQKKFNSEYQVRDFISEKLVDKRNKGYKPLITEYKNLFTCKGSHNIKSEWVEGGNRAYLPF